MNTLQEPPCCSAFALALSPPRRFYLSDMPLPTRRFVDSARRADSGPYLPQPSTEPGSLYSRACAKLRIVASRIFHESH